MTIICPLAKVGALRRLRKLVPADISLILYKANILPHLEYCSLLKSMCSGINKTLNKKLASSNHYALYVKALKANCKYKYCMS